METRWGKRLGRYEIVAELGRGAMGVVYKARDPKIDRFVAIKTISLLGQSPEDEREYRQRFFHEAQAAGRMFHPGIVTVFDVGEEPETREPYIVMEYISGQTLDRMLSAENKKLPLELALRLTQELAEALDYAHAQGVVHRDIKPANILITEDQHAKIADFGIAKLNISHLTLPGHALGTPAYMSPEQLSGEPVDLRSDLFSLGVIFYNMITGFSPFQGNSVATVCFKVMNREPVPATALAAELPAEVDAIMVRAIAKNPALRYQRGIDFALDIGELRQRFMLQGDTRINHWANGKYYERVPEVSEGSDPASPKGPPPGLATDTQVRLNGKLPAAAAPPGFDRHLLKIAIGSALLLLFFVAAVTLHRPQPPTATHPRQVATIIPKAVAPANPAPAPTPTTLPAADAAGEMATPQTAQPAPKIKTRSASIRPPRPAPASLKPAPEATAPVTAATSTLAIEIDHPFADGAVSVWVDDQLAYSHTLHGDATRRLVLFHGARGHETGIASLSEGQHRLRVRVQSSAHAFDENQTIQGNFTRGQSRTLSVSFVGHNKDIHLALD